MNARFKLTIMFYDYKEIVFYHKYMTEVIDLIENYQAEKIRLIAINKETN